MQGRNPYEDELARRRAMRRATRAAGAEQEDRGGEDEEMPRLGWQDTLALIIAAYQVLLPMLLIMVGALILVYFLFKWYFH